MLAITPTGIVCQSLWDIPRQRPLTAMVAQISGLTSRMNSDIGATPARKSRFHEKTKRADTSVSEERVSWIK